MEDQELNTIRRSIRFVKYLLFAVLVLQSAVAYQSIKRSSADSQWAVQSAITDRELSQLRSRVRVLEVATTNLKVSTRVLENYHATETHGQTQPTRSKISPTGPPTEPATPQHR